MSLFGQTEPFPSLRFSKTGAQVKVAVQGRITTLSASMEASSAALENECRKFDVPPLDVRAANKDDAAWHKMALRLTASGATNENVKFLDQYARNEAEWQRKVKDASALAESIETGRTFDLTYTELLNLGF